MGFASFLIRSIIDNPGESTEWSLEFRRDGQSEYLIGVPFLHIQIVSVVFREGVLA